MRSSLLFLGAAVLGLMLASCSGKSSAPPVTTTTGLNGQLVQGTGTKVTTAVGDGLSGMQLQLISQSTGQVAGSTTTGSDGRFSFTDLPNGGFLLKIRFQGTADLDGDGLLDFIESYIPITLTADQIAQLTAALGFDDTDSDSKDDALKIDIRFRVSASGSEQHSVRIHRHRHGDTEVDNDGNGSIDDDFSDDNNDGLPDDNSDGHGQGSVHSGVWRGQISAISATSLTVGGQTFTLNSGTSFSSKGHNNAQSSDFAVGDWVQVKSITGSDGTQTALEVRLKHGHGNGGNDDNVQEIQGTISALTDTSVTIGGKTYTITGDTVFLLSNKSEGAASDFAVGDFVELKIAQSGSGWNVLRIKQEDQNDDNGGSDEREFSGTISAISATSVTVNGKTFSIDSSTQFSGGATGTIDDFLVGGSVEIHARLNGDQWVATLLTLDDNGGDDNGGGGGGDD